jgi:hypothetical protein
MELEGSLPCSQEPAIIPVLSQMNPVHTLPLYFCKISFNILPSSPRLVVVTLLKVSSPKRLNFAAMHATTLLISPLI